MTSKRKPTQNNRKPQGEPAVINDSDSEQGIDDRASVAPSEGAHGQQPRSGNGSRSLSAKYDDLPNGVSRSEFKDVFMSTVAKYVVKLTDQDPWNNSTKNYTDVIQHVWNAVFPHVPYKFSFRGARCPVFRLVSPYLIFMNVLLICSWSL